MNIDNICKKHGVKKDVIMDIIHLQEVKDRDKRLKKIESLLGKI